MLEIESLENFDTNKYNLTFNSYFIIKIIFFYQLKHDIKIKKCKKN